MSKIVLLNVKAYAVAADLTSPSNKVELTGEYEAKDATTYGSDGWKAVLPGLASAGIDAAGFWEAGSADLVDDASWDQLGGTGPWTICPDQSSVGSLAYATQALRSSYQLGGTVGEMAPWTGKASSSWPLVRGQIAHPPGTPRTATGTGTGLQLGAVPAGRRLFLFLHVLSASGTTPSLTVRVESDSDNTFASPTTQLTATAATAAGGQSLRTAGSAITDTWYRLGWTISGTTPSFTFVAALGIA